jgi:antitoxin (DNA-binding transcriptional repressor) of toxin-antitoxin stability system
MVKIADLKNNLSRHISHVRQGGQITVLDRDTPVARIVPFLPAETAGQRGTEPATAERMADLARQGVLTLGDAPAAVEWLDAHPPLRLPRGSRGAVDVLLEMRRESTR